MIPWKKVCCKYNALLIGDLGFVNSGFGIWDLGFVD
jgi:hypothetical protein